MTDWVIFKPIIKSIESDPVCLSDLQVSPQFIGEEDNEMESENEICVLLNQSDWGKVIKESCEYY